ncbi:MAG: thioredoxin domain-containing protein [Rariglobus sp.]
MIRVLLTAALIALTTVSAVAENALAKASSPYLRQHADNPVNWYPWGEEALALARRENKPIFLSSGYSTCHWCHVMKRESFANAEVAAFLNKHFISIKLDREERPDIDRIYLTFVAATTGQGGWPLNVWLTPDLQPFLGGTYFPPTARDGLPAFIDVARAAARGWESERDQVVAHAAKITRALQQSALAPAGSTAASNLFGPAAWDAAFNQLSASFDPEHGGFGRDEKFPHAPRLHYLFRYAVAADTSADNAARARQIALDSLAAIVNGGLHDKIGGGFHRYAVDRQWAVPHYEKMLYDQAQITFALLDAYQLTGDARWATAVRSTLAFVERELTSPEGAFYAALDAESLPSADTTAPVEGAYYTVSAAERARLPRPHRDEKIIAAWNGYAISAFARAYQVLGDERYLTVATRAAAQLLKTSFDAKTAQLSRIPGQPAAFAEDYASVIHAALDVYDASFDPRWLDQALALQATQDRLFWDEKNGGYFNTAAGDASVLVRLKQDFDDAEPSANSLSAHNLRRLGALTATPLYSERARAVFAAFTAQQAASPQSLPVLLSASLGASGKARQIVIAGAPNQPDTRALLAEARRPFQPFSTVILADGGLNEARLTPHLDVFVSMQPIGGRATAYVCENFVCQAPVKSAAALARLLRPKS